MRKRKVKRFWRRHKMAIIVTIVTVFIGIPWMFLAPLPKTTKADKEYMPHGFTMKAVVSAYSDPETISGKPAQEHYTCAADTNKFPTGTQILIGDNIYEVDAMSDDGSIKIYVANPEIAATIPSREQNIKFWR